MKPKSSPPVEANKEQDALLKQFRAYLHLVITAQQTGRTRKLKTLPGPQLHDYCGALAHRPDNMLAGELAQPVVAILDQMSELARGYEEILRRKDEKSVAMHATARRILDQLDFALAFVLRQRLARMRSRGAVTQNLDLLGQLTEMAIGDGVEAAGLIRRYQSLNPEDPRNADGSPVSESYPDLFAWDAYQRIEALDDLADEFPDYLRTAARQMHAWPMLMHRHAHNRRRFKQLAQRLELGVKYPTDASEGARFRPDTPLVRYLDPLINRLHGVCRETRNMQFESIEQEQHLLYRMWWSWPKDRPNEEVIAVIHAARLLPPLTKATAAQWAEKALVPLILVTDARDYTNCTEPVLKKISEQKGVKSRATFKSRLLAAVTATLQRLARPA